MEELRKSEVKLNQIISEMLRKGKNVSLSPEFRQPMACGKLGTCPHEFKLNINLNK